MDSAVYSDAEHKQIRDTMNKQNRLTRLFTQRALMAGATVGQVQAAKIAAEAVANCVLVAPEGHQQATINAATTLMGGALMLQAILTKMEAEEAAAAPATVAEKPAKKATKKSA
jgi:hypothetical protein